MFKHYIITRFNLRAKEWQFTKNSTRVLDDNWLKNRFELFEKYCLPSLISQTNKNFEWVIYFDTETPAFYKDKIESYRQQLPNLVPVFVENMEFFLPSIQEHIKNNNQEYVITTRLDNDDCVSKYFVDEIQKNFSKQEYEALDFVDGYSLQISPDFKLGKKRHLYNPFISLVEKKQNSTSVWSRSHTSWKRETKIKRIFDNRIWMVIIHQENKVNEFDGYGKVNAEEVFQDFMMDETIIQKVLSQQIPVEKWYFQSMKNKLTTFTNIFFKDLKKKLNFYKS
jgi:hypothetical protein